MGRYQKYQEGGENGRPRMGIRDLSRGLVPNLVLRQKLDFPLPEMEPKFLGGWRGTGKWSAWPLSTSKRLSWLVWPACPQSVRFPLYVWPRRFLFFGWIVDVTLWMSHRLGFQQVRNEPPLQHQEGPRWEPLGMPWATHAARVCRVLVSALVSSARPCPPIVHLVGVFCRCQCFCAPRRTLRRL
jgi:hypothetical protein